MVTNIHPPTVIKNNHVTSATTDNEGGGEPGLQLYMVEFTILHHSSLKFIVQITAYREIK